MAQKRARQGGEVGVNGEHYAGGTFLPTTTLGKMARVARKPATRKVQVGPFEWAVQPTPGAAPIYVGAVGGVFATDRGPGRPLSTVADEALAYLDMTREELADRVARHARGERWL